MDILQWIKNGFAKIPHYLKELATKALDFTKELSAVLNSQEAQQIVDTIPGDFDDKVLAEAKAFAAFVQSLLAKAVDVTDNEKYIELAKNALLQKTQSYVTALQDESKLPENQYDSAAQTTYSKLKAD